MQDRTDRILGRLAAASLRECAERLSRVSSAAWSVSRVEVAAGSLEAALKRYASDRTEAEAVYFDVKGDLPFAAILLFDPRDIESISDSFFGLAFARRPELDKAVELFLSDLGSVVLNAFVGAVSDAVGRVFMPSPPRCVRGEPRFLLEAIGTFLDLPPECSMVRAQLSLRCGDKHVRTELLGLVPEKLEREIVKADAGR